MSDAGPKLTPTFADMVKGQAQQGLSQGQALGQMAALNQGLAGLNQYTGSNQFLAFPASRVIPAQIEQSLPPPAPNPQREKVAIIGTAPSSRKLAPFQDMAWDIWGCSPGNMNEIPRIDAWFEIHANLHWPEYADAYGKNYIKWLSEQSFPVYLQDEPWHQKYFPHGIRFPARELVKKYGRNFFTSSFSWMTAFAIYKGYKEIGLYGVDMASKDEYIQQRQAHYYWEEKAASLGIKITIPPESDLKQPQAIYGYSDATRFGRKLHARAQELKTRSEHIRQVELGRMMNEIKKAEQNATYLEGAHEDNDYVRSIWMGIGDEWGEIPLDAAIEVVKDAGYQVSKPSEPVVQVAMAQQFPVWTNPSPPIETASVVPAEPPKAKRGRPPKAKAKESIG